MTNPTQYRRPERLSDQDLFQSLIQQLSKLSGLEATIGDITIDLSAIAQKMDLIVAELQTQNTHLSVLASEAPPQTTALEAMATEAPLQTAALQVMATEAPLQTAALEDCLSEIAQTYTAEGGAGLLVTQDKTDTQTISTDWVTLDDWDDNMLPEQDASADPVSGRITFLATGTWAVSFNSSMLVTPSIANENRVLEIAAYNTVTLAQTRIGSANIPRYADTAQLSAYLKIDVSADEVGDAIALAVRVPVGHSDVEITQLDAGAQFSVGRTLTRL